jgi:hypothetical protein
MTIHLLDSKKLAAKLGNDQVSARQKGYYLAISFLMFTAIYYSGLTNSNPLGSWLFYIEALMVAGITILGFTKCYEAAGDDANSDFVAQFTCLYVPVTITTYIPIWGCYWAITFGFSEAIKALSESHLQIAINLHKIGADFFGLLVFLTALLVQAITFYRITKLFAIVGDAPTASENR